MHNHFRVVGGDPNAGFNLLAERADSVSAFEEAQRLLGQASAGTVACITGRGISRTLVRTDAGVREIGGRS